MMRTLAIALTLTLAPATPLCAQDAPAPAPAAAAPADITTILEEAIARHKLPGMAAATVEADGAISAIGAAGLRARGHDELITIDDLWHLGSCTKSMTASLCAMLVEDGLLRWDMTLAEAFPDVAASMTEGYRAVTLEQLLSHRAGAPTGTGRRQLWSAFWTHKGTPTEARRMALLGVTERDPEFPPGTKYEYSNYGYMLAGHMCEKVTGEPFEKLLIDRLLAPLGITTAGWGAPGAQSAPSESAPPVIDQPRGHRLRQPVAPGPLADNPPAMSPAGRVHMSLRDWSRYIAWHLRAGVGAAGKPELLKPESFAALHTPPAGADYALGWSCPHRDWAGGRALAHTGSNTMWYCVVWAAPARGFAVLVATNEGGDAAAKACDEVAGALIRRHTSEDGE